MLWVGSIHALLNELEVHDVIIESEIPFEDRFAPVCYLKVHIFVFESFYQFLAVSFSLFGYGFGRGFYGVLPLIQVFICTGDVFYFSIVDISHFKVEMFITIFWDEPKHIGRVDLGNVSGI